jgi:uncharacterized repeat protein (TIGR01451 family)
MSSNAVNFQPLHVNFTSSIFRRFGATQLAAIAILIVAALSTNAVGQNCPTSPSYAPDFSTNQNCLTVNNSAILVPGDSTALQLTNSSGSQVGSAWYNTPQSITNGFSTTFQFQFTNPSNPPADGITFIVQNSGTSAIGYLYNGGALGYGDDDSNTNPSTGEGIPDSLAIEFDTFQNAWDPAPISGVESHVAIQSCGTGANTSHHNYLCGGNAGANSTIGAPVITENIADGNVHTVTIQYIPNCSTCNPATVANIQVTLDGTSIYPNGVSVDLGSLLGLGTNGTAYVGFTGATGGEWETQDILDWTFAPTQQGQQINSNNASSLNQSFVASNTTGEHIEFDFNYSVSNNNGNLTIQSGTTPYLATSGITPFDWASIVNGTAMADAPCLTANGQNVCVVNTLTCTTSSDSNAQGTNCPQSTVRNILYQQEIDVNQNQPGIVNGILTVPSGYAPGMAMAPDVLVSGGPCSFPSNSPLATALCPQSILTQLEDNTPRGGGSATTTNSTYVFFCCEPEWQTTPSIPLWYNALNVPASFTSTPPPTPNPNTNNFVAAQGASVVFGAEPRGQLLDTTFPLPGEQTVNNLVPCPTLAVAPANPWSTQNAQAFGVSGMISTYDNNGTASPLTEGAYDAHYFSVDCDAFEELVYPPTLNVTPGTPGANEATFKTVPFNIDTTKPMVSSITLNTPGGYYAQGTSPTVTVTCTDPSSPSVANFYSGVAQCGAVGSPQRFSGNLQSVTTNPITLNTSVLGTQSFAAAATDVAGNSSAASSITYQVVGSANLAIGMLGNLLVKTGTNMTYYIFVANSGPNTANLVSIADTLPTGTTFVSSGYAIESCALTGGKPQCSITPANNPCGSVAGTCNIGNLPAWTNKNPTGALVQITVNVNAKANTVLNNSTVVSEANSNPNSKNDVAKWATLVTK